MNIDVMYSSKSNEWATPMDFFKKLDQEFHFNLDPCSTDENHKCDKYYTIKDDGLQKNWGGTESFVIHHTARRLVIGLRSATGKALRITL